MAGHEVEGIEGCELEAPEVALAFDGYGQQPVPERQSRPAGFAQWQRHFRHRDHVEPLDVQVVGQFAHVSLLIHHAGIQHIIDRGALALRGGPQNFGEGGKVVATGAAGRINQKLGHGAATSCRLNAAKAQTCLLSS